jgi:PAS domain S-box-containing protein
MKEQRQQGRRIVWLVRVLAAVGLALVILTTGLIGWTLARVRHERAAVMDVQEQLNQTALLLRESAGASQIELLNFLDDPRLSSHSQAVADFSDLICSQREAQPDPAVSRALTVLNEHAATMQNIARRAAAWGSNYNVIWQDLQQQITANRVRAQIAQLRNAVEAVEGRRRLQEAKRHQQWRKATGETATHLAEAILTEQGGQQSRSAAEFKAELAEFACEVEQLGGEESNDNLANLRDNKLGPTLEWLSRAVSAFDTGTNGASGLTTGAIEKLRRSVFDEADSENPARQDGLFALRRKALQLRRERELLKSELIVLFHEIEDTNAVFAQSAQARTTELAHQLESSLTAGWQQSLLLGGGCAAVFLWLAWVVSRGVSGQVNALEQARAEAEESRRVTQKLMQDQQAANAALTETNSLLETMLENCPDAIYFKDAASRFMHFSKSFRQFLKVERPEDLKGKSDFDFFTKEHSQPAFDDEQQIICTGQPLIGKLEKETHSDGRVTWAMTSKMPWRDKAGQIIGTFGISTDVTLLKKAEDELAAAHVKLQVSEQRFRTLSASAPIGIFLNDAKGKLLYVNPHWLSITGLTLEESLGDGWQKALHPDDAAEMLEARKAAARRGWGFSHEFRFRRPTGEERWVRACSVVVRSETGQTSGYVGTTEDITERRRSEELLRLQEAALRSAANVVVITGRDGNIVWTNPAFTKITGYTAEEVLGQNPRILKRKEAHTPYPANYFHDLWKTIAGGAVWHGEFQNVRKDGSALIEEAIITPVPNKKGDITHFVAVKQDITERKRAEEELAKAQKDLLESTRLAGMAEVATGVLHNVGNVLNSVNVGANCVAEGLRKSRVTSLAKVVALLRQQEADLGGFFASDPRGKQLPAFLEQLTSHLTREQTNAITELGEVQKHIEHIKDIVAMQQNFAKVGGVKESVLPTNLVEDALQMNISSIERHDVRVIKDYQEVPLVMVDKHKALQILVNLIRNAKQACDEANRDEKLLTLRIMSAGDRVHITVADNGVGIPAENLTRVFNHGFTTKKDGHGFGLHSGALAAKEMGGSLHVRSDGTGCGAIFTLELPTPPSQ